MGLIGNRFRNSTGVHRAFGDLPAYSVPRQYSDWCNTRSREGATTVLDTLASPLGASGSAAWFPPQEAGEMALRSDASGDLSADLIPSRRMTIDLTGAGDLDATATLAVAMGLAMTGAGSLTATIQGRLNATVDMTGSGDLEANLSGLGNMVIAMLGVGDLEATISAFGEMTIDIVVTGTGLSTANVGQAVWAEVLESGFTAEELMRLISAALAGKVSGAAGTTVTIRDINDTKNRIVATVDADGNRTAVTKDVT